MTTVMAFGKFRILHSGHVKFLQKAAEYGDKLIVVLARDATIRKDGLVPIIPEQERIDIIGALKVVDRAVLGYEGYPEGKIKIIKEINPDIIVLGPDQKVDENNLSKELEKEGLTPKIFRIPDLLGGKVNKTQKVIDSFSE